MAVEVINKKGKVITLLSPAEKGQKFASELRRDIKLNNRFLPKTHKGNVIPLSKEESAYRSGYIAARKDNAKAYNAIKRKKK